MVLLPPAPTHLDICAENGYDALESFSSESSGVDDEGARDSVTVGVCKDVVTQCVLVHLVCHCWWF